MNGSTLHRSSLTRENIGVLASITKTNLKQNPKHQLNKYYKSTKSQELDLLWDAANKGVQRVRNIAKPSGQKSPAAYLTIGFISGVLFMAAILLIVSVFSITPKEATSIEPSAASQVALIGEENNNGNNNTNEAADTIETQEKYVVKSGDTLNGIAYRFYGKYDQAKIDEIQKLNSINNAGSLKIGQELLIPVSQER